MALSRISLINPDEECIWEDVGAKTVAFFCVQRPVHIDAGIIAELKIISDQRNGSNVRVSLHSGPDANHHDMVILEHSGKYYRPHKHNAKGECFHVIEGRLGVLSFDSQGNVVDAVALNAGEIYRVGEDMFHAILPMSDPVIYHENKPGPFTGKGDSIFPDWAPDGADAAVAEAYVDELRKHLQE